MNSDGSGKTNLTQNATNDLIADWSQDGGKLAFFSLRDGNYDVYVMNADGSNQTQLTTDPALDFSPAWSPGFVPAVIVPAVGPASSGQPGSSIAAAVEAMADIAADEFPLAEGAHTESVSILRGQSNMAAPQNA